MYTYFKPAVHYPDFSRKLSIIQLKSKSETSLNSINYQTLYILIHFFQPKYVNVLFKWVIVVLTWMWANGTKFCRVKTSSYQKKIRKPNQCHLKTTLSDNSTKSLEKIARQIEYHLLVHRQPKGNPWINVWHDCFHFEIHCLSTAIVHPR